MNEELLSLAKEQIPKLPESLLKVFQDPQTSTQIATIGQFLGLTNDQTGKLNLEITLLLLGLINPQSFPEVLKKELEITDDIQRNLIQKLEGAILNPIYGDLMRFYDEDQKVLKDVSGASETPNEPAPGIKKMPDVAPDNLPTVSDETEHPEFLPVLIPKTDGVPLETPTPLEKPAEAPHPFEEKMQKVFTGGAPAMDTLKIEDASNSKPALDISRIKHDPYREPIEL